MQAQKKGQALIDSLQDRINKYTSPCKTPCILDSVEVNRLIDLAWEYNTSKPDSTFKIVNQALTLAKSINHETGIAQCYHVFGTYYKGISEIETALKYFEDELSLLEKLIANANEKNKKLFQSKKAACLNSFALVYKITGENAKAIKAYTNALEINEVYNNRDAIAINYKNIGDLYIPLGNYPRALDCLLKALQFAEKIGNERIAAATLGSVGLIYRKQSDFDKAIEYYNVALALNTKRNDKSGMGINLGLLGVSYAHKKNVLKAIECYNKSLDIFTEIGYKQGIASIHNNLGEVYNQQGNDLISQQQYDSAKIYNGAALKNFLKALNMQSKIGRNSELATYLGNVGAVNIDLKNEAQGIHYLEMSRKLFDSLQDYEGVQWANEKLGNYYTKNGDYEKGLFHYKQSVIAKDSLFNEAKIAELTTLDLIYQFSKKEAQVKSSFDLQTAKLEADKIRIASEAEKKRLIEEANSRVKIEQANNERILAQSNLEISEANRKRTISETENKIALTEADKKRTLAEANAKKIAAEADAEKQAYVKNFTLAAAGILLSSSVLIFLFYKRRRDAVQKQKETSLSLQVSETEMKALRSQMNPHFIFNALQSIQTFLISHQPEDANTYLLKFSKLMRLVLENSQHSEVSLKDDMHALELYMQLESVRLKNPFTYQFHIDEAIDIEETTIPPLILQPFVENAIWHGLQYKSEPGHIDILISRRDNALYATVEDNGVGRDTAKAHKQPILMKKESLGMKLTEERLNILNELKNIKAQFKITDLFTKNNQPAGTKVELSLPLTG